MAGSCHRAYGEWPAGFAACLVVLGVWQVHTSLPGFDAVHQYPIEPDVVAKGAERSATRPRNPKAVELRPMTPEEAAGVPAEVQFTVRDAAGRVYRPLQVSLREVRYEPAQYDIPLREVPAEALIDGSVWCVFVVFVSEDEAPAT